MTEYIMEVADNGMVSKVGQELVRCKDCKYLLEHDTGELECEIKAGWFQVKPNWFCADGKRK